MTASFLTAGDVFDRWRDDVLTGAPPVLYPVGTGELARLEIGPGRVTLFGGAPGGGKTALVMQIMSDALRLTPWLRVLVCSVEMSPTVLLDRQLARLSGIDLGTIRHRRFGAEHADCLDQALATLEALTERLCFVRTPFSLKNVANSADAFQADVVVLDYVQRIAPPGNHRDKRGAVDASMDYLRQFADADVAVIAVAAVSRTKDSRGRSTYDGAELNLASFRESSELEYGADDAYLLVPESNGGMITLRHLKARHSERRDLHLLFDPRLQRFTSVAGGSLSAGRPPSPRPLRENRPQLTAALQALWQPTEATADHVETEGGDA